MASESGPLSVPGGIGDKLLAMSGIRIFVDKGQHHSGRYSLQGGAFFCGPEKIEIFFLSTPKEFF